MYKIIQLIVFTYILQLLPVPVQAKITLSVLFTNNMVLQQKDNVPVWGSTSSGKNIRITTSWNNKVYTVKPGPDGKWKTTVSTPSYGGPYSMTFDDGEVLKLNNILIGEVWVCSGQSNMEMPLAGWGKINNYKEEIAAASYPEIHLLQIQKNTSTTPLSEITADGDGWQECTPSTISGFSSVAYFFAKNLFEAKHVPVGVIHTSWGGTIAEAWTSGTALKKMPEFLGEVERMENDKDFEKKETEKYNQEIAARNRTLDEKDPGLKTTSWASRAVDVSSWQTMPLPTLWEQAGLPDFDGVVWFRKKIMLPETWKGKSLTLNLGPIDDMDVTWFNGTVVGMTDGWERKRTYTIPGNLVKTGENIIAVRVLDGSGGGGIYGEPQNMFLQTNTGEKLELAGPWAYKVALTKEQLPAMPVQRVTGPNRPTVLYNAMIHPLIPYAIKGAIWYQGESNADRAYQYRELFPLMISDWRKNWGRGNFPFYFVQLANFMKPDQQPAESAWAELREAQKMTLSLPNTGMATAIDIGDENDIHPKNKQEVGRRLALIALANLYGENVAWSGPVYKSYKTDGNKIRLSFSHTDKGLQAKGSDTLKGFAIAGSDHKFYWATAAISGNEVVVSSPQVTDPVAVRYAWGNNPQANLCNAAGLPAPPFRTDDWQGVTYGKK